MVTKEFKCNCKGYVPITKTIDVPMSESYRPTCPNCEKPMQRVYAATDHIKKSFNGG